MRQRFRNTSGWAMAGVALFALVFVAAAAAEDAPATDLSITDVVEDKLEDDPAVDLNRILVSTEDGIVTLDGRTANLLSKRRAERIAETVRGVRAVVNHLEVLPRPARGDAEIAADVRTALLYDPATKSYNVDVSVDGGVVTLNGEVASWQQRELAEKAAAGVQGVQAIHNTVRVDYEVDRPDHEIRAEIEGALQWDVQVDEHRVRVDVRDGVVTLGGEAGSMAEKTAAISNAWVAGVESVDATGLEVEELAREEAPRDVTPVRRTDAEILDAVDNALAHDERVASFEVRTSAEDGVVTLRGSVENLLAKRAAEQAARRVAYVADVDNRLRVRPGVVIPDSDIADNVRAALSRDPYVNRFDITVSVVDANAYLYGSVDTYFEKARADEVSATAEGVERVHNHLVIAETRSPYAYSPHVDDWRMHDYDWYDYRPSYSLQSDAEIREDIDSNLWWSPFVSSGDVNVTVENGTATLTGTVSSWSEYHAAARNAFDAGATWVVNNLVVE